MPTRVAKALPVPEKLRHIHGHLIDTTTTLSPHCFLESWIHVGYITYLPETERVTRMIRYRSRSRIVARVSKGFTNELKKPEPTGSASGRSLPNATVYVRVH